MAFDSGLAVYPKHSRINCIVALLNEKQSSIHKAHKTHRVVVIEKEDAPLVI